MTVRLEGLEDLRRVLATADLKIKVAVNREVDKIATDIENESMTLVPFDEGILAGSVTKTKSSTGGFISQTVAYGGPGAPYALIQHENMEFWHPPKPPGKSKVGKKSGIGPGIPGQTQGAKYLEIPAKRHQRTLVPRMIAAIKKVL
jgi:hypothetical protein